MVQDASPSLTFSRLSIKESSESFTKPVLDPNLVFALLLYIPSLKANKELVNYRNYETRGYGSSISTLATFWLFSLISVWGT